MTRPEIKATFSLVLLAGSETTATLLSGATFYLLQNPDALQKLTTEIHNAFSKVEDITFNTVARLPYLQACIQEALRMYPPIPGIFPRRTAPEGDIINGRFIPGNVRTEYVLVSFTQSKTANRFRWVSTNGAPTPLPATSKTPKSTFQNVGSAIPAMLKTIVPLSSHFL